VSLRFTRENNFVPVVGDDIVAARHENIEGTVGRFQNHNAGVEDGLVITGGGHLREIEEDVEVA